MAKMVNVVVIHDEYEKKIRNLKETIDDLSLAEDVNGTVGKYDYAVEVLRKEIWNLFDEMCAEKAAYTSDEYNRMFLAHIDRRNAQKAKLNKYTVGNKVKHSGVVYEVVDFNYDEDAAGFVYDLAEADGDGEVCDIPEDECAAC